MGGFYEKKPEQLCWTCQNACTGGCSWSEAMEPVDGWKTVETVHSNGSKGLLVTGCPQYVRDSEESRILDLNTDGCLELVERLMEITREDYIKGNEKTRKEIQRFIRGKGASRIHMITNPEEVIQMLEKARIEHKKKMAQLIL